jgi:hypothetical protein
MNTFILISALMFPLPNDAGWSVLREAPRYGLCPMLVRSVIMAESEGFWWARSSCRSAGYCQIHPVHHERGINPYGTRWNIRKGCAILSIERNESRGHFAAGYRHLRYLTRYERGPRGKGMNIEYLSKICRRM